jgi:carbon-monoxide dehydrogenase medium subunit
MTRRIREYIRPVSQPEALSQLGRANSAALMVGPRVPAAPVDPAAVAVDLSMLGLDLIVEDGAVIRLGAQVSLQALVDSPVIRNLAHGLLARAAQLAAHRGLRHLATLAGALYTREGPPELLLALLALDAAVVHQGIQTRTTPLAVFRPAAGELLVEVQVVRPPAPVGAALARVARSPLDQAIVAAAAVVTEAWARVAVAGASPRPIIKTGASLTDVAAGVTAEAEPMGDHRGSARYRRAMAEVLARRALADAARKKAQP